VWSNGDSINWSELKVKEKFLGGFELFVKRLLVGKIPKVAREDVRGRV
jgi:hypothetical protein